MTSNTGEDSQFRSVTSFNATVNTLDGNVIVRGCRMTLTPKLSAGAGRDIRRTFNIDETDDIIALYLSGDEHEFTTGPLSGQKTASGHCVFFVFRTADHGELESQTELTIRSEAAMYFKKAETTSYVRGTFADLTTVGQDRNRLSRTSSTRTGHLRESILLFP